VLEPCCEQTGTIVFDPDGTSDATNVSGHAPCYGLGKLVFKGNIADGNSSTGLEDTGNLTEYGWLIGRKIENAI